MPATGLSENPDFRKLWIGQSISHIGSNITRVGLPLTAVIVLHASPLQMGFLSASEAVAVLFLSLFAGAWADRLRRRPILIFADLARAAVLASIPLLAFFQRLTMPHLYLIFVLTGLLAVAFDVSYQAYLPSLVTRESLVDSNAKLALTESIAEVAGPGLTGLLVQIMTAPLTIALDAISFLLSAISLALIRKPEVVTLQPSKRNMRREIFEGLRGALDNPLLRPILWRTVTSSFFLGFGASLYFLFVSLQLNVPAGWLGLVISIGGACNLLGALGAKRLLRRFGYGRTLIASALLSGLSMLFVPFAHGSLPLCLVFLMTAQLGDMGWPVYKIAAQSLQQSITPEHLLGRVTATLHLAYQGVMPIGALAGGAIAQMFGVRNTLLLAAAGFLLSTFWFYLSPLRTLRNLPAVNL